MRVASRDPITRNDVRNRRNAPFVVEGDGADALVIYFESDQSRKAYLAIPVRMATPRSVELHRQLEDGDKVMRDTMLRD